MSRTASLSTVKFVPFPEEQKFVDLVNDEGQVKERLDLDDSDPIFHMPFRQMITESFA